MPSVRGYWLDDLRHPFRGGTEKAFMSGMSVRRSTGKRGRSRRAEVRFGPAGWMYEDWEGIVYPKVRASFDVLMESEKLVEEGVGFVNIDQPLFSKSIGPTSHATSRVGYIRVHGRNYKDWFRKKAPADQRYNYLYRADQLEPWVERTKEVAADPAVRRVSGLTRELCRVRAEGEAQHWLASFIDCGTLKG